jgi:hypothetical protein
MNRYLTSHPGAECLLQFADGELPGRHAADVRSHLEACWRCRTEVDDLKTAIADFMRYRRALVVPDPPASWESFENRLDRLIAERQSRPRFRWPAYVAALAALAAAAVLLTVELNHPATVSAAELLRKASAREGEAGHRPHRVRIHDPAHRTEAELRAIFAQAKYDFEDPLSAHAYQAWHEGLPERRDEVVLRSGVWRVRTETSSKPLEEAVLRLNEDDLRVVGGSFRFHGQETVEMEPLPDQAAPAPEKSDVAPRAARSSPPIPAAATPEEELRVLTALHGADRGEQIELTRDDSGGLVVTATAISPARRAVIEGALGPLTAVTLRFLDPNIDLSQPAQTESGHSVVSAANPLEPALRASLGGATELSRVTDLALEESAAAMVQAHGLRQLAVRFPREVEARLDAGGREALGRLRHDHAASLAQHARELDRLLVPLLRSLGAPLDEAAGPLSERSDWQSASEALFAATQRFDTTATALLTGGAADPGHLVADTGRALKQWRAAIDWYSRL